MLSADTESNIDPTLLFPPTENIVEMNFTSELKKFTQHELIKKSRIRKRMQVKPSTHLLLLLENLTSSWKQKKQGHGGYVRLAQYEELENKFKNFYNKMYKLHKRNEYDLMSLEAVHL
jgi:hypothetical protein